MKMYKIYGKVSDNIIDAQSGFKIIQNGFNYKYSIPLLGSLILIKKRVFKGGLIIGLCTPVLLFIIGAAKIHEFAILSFAMRITILWLFGIFLSTLSTQFEEKSLIAKGYTLLLETYEKNSIDAMKNLHNAIAKSNNLSIRV
ncbi:hypothetical protein [Candidatus Deianiraea vastatrix]|uniref:Uncharacterized protein n=1 Tax=Candidatus Deianiraea vastatrix TaxID=2163644 RepID=A0A5B8XET2_9RICK|nr:hypothetical protein [Candidatus Deianiraea vastatrix]QED23750.1 hypothetical protein Deia_00964 [Candidatus Deianiraea vastatrix]